MRAVTVDFMQSARRVAAAAALLAGCAVSHDAIREAAVGGAAAPGFAETRAIAADGFVYGLPA